MTTSSTPRVSRPNPRIPQLIGTLNLLLGVLLLLAAMASVAWTVGSPYLFQRLNAQTQADLDREKAERESRLSALRVKEKAATSSEEKAALQEEIDELEAETGLNAAIPWQSESEADPRLTVPYWIETILGLVLNVLLTISGFGLLRLRPWGRTIALWVSGAKIVVLTAGLAYAILVAAPLQAERIRDEFFKMQARWGGAGTPGPTLVAQSAASSAAMLALASLGGFLIAVLYPGLTLWLLNKNGVKAALLERPGSKRSTPPGKDLT